MRKARACPVAEQDGFIFMRILKTWWEIIAVPVAIGIFIAYPYLWSADNPNAPAGWSAIYLQKLLYACLIVICGNALASLFPKIDNEQDGEDNKLTEWQKRISYLVRYVSLLLAFCLSMQALGAR